MLDARRSPPGGAAPHDACREGVNKLRGAHGAHPLRTQVRLRAEAGVRRLRAEAAVALPGWLTARLVVLGVLLFANFLFNHLHADLTRKTLDQGLLSWDGQWYRRIAEHGYAAIPRTGVRFFPL